MKYELMTILDGKKTDKEIEKTLGEVRALAEENELKLEAEDLWGHRPLAYKIGPHKSGFYAVFLFKGEGKGAQEFQRDLRIQAGLIRTILVKMPDDYTLMRLENMTGAMGKAKKLSSHAEELAKKVTRKRKEEEAPEKTEEMSEKLEAQLQSIVDHPDIDL